MSRPRVITLSRRSFLQLAGIALTGLGAPSLIARPGQALAGPAAPPNHAGRAALNDFIERYAPEAVADLPLNTKVQVLFTRSSASGDSIDPASIKLFINGVLSTMTPDYVQSAGNRAFRFVPFPFWAPGRQYSIVIRAGVEYVKSGESMLEDATWAFTTEGEAIEEDFDPASTRPLDSSELAIVNAGSRFTDADLVTDYQDAASTLYRISEAVDPADPDVVRLGEKMIDSLRSLGAIGLAAPQIGINRRLFVAQISGEKRVFINPKIEDWSSEVYFGSVEGCLSIDRVRAKVGRPDWVQVGFQEPGGRLVSGEYLRNDNAKVWLHEYDHINGILMTDRQQEKRFGASAARESSSLIPITPVRF